VKALADAMRIFILLVISCECVGWDRDMSFTLQRQEQGSSACRQAAWSYVRDWDRYYVIL